MSRASSFCAAGKETGGTGVSGGAVGAALALALEFVSGGGGLAVMVVLFEGSGGLDGFLEALLEAGGLVGAGRLGAGGDAALRGG